LHVFQLLDERRVCSYDFHVRLLYLVALRLVSHLLSLQLVSGVLGSLIDLLLHLSNIKVCDPASFSGLGVVRLLQLFCNLGANAHPLLLIAFLVLFRLLPWDVVSTHSSVSVYLDLSLGLNDLCRVTLSGLGRVLLVTFGSSLEKIGRRGHIDLGYSSNRMAATGTNAHETRADILAAHLNVGQVTLAAVAMATRKHHAASDGV